MNKDFASIVFSSAVGDRRYRQFVFISPAIGGDEWLV